MATIEVEDKTPHILPFLLPLISEHQAHLKSPFFLGLSGVQGAGKTYLVDSLAAALSSPPHNLRVVVFSIDDLYLTHADQVALAEAHPANKLVSHRGEPGTHDMKLGIDTLKALKSATSAESVVPIPFYNKSLFSGAGDRAPPSEWKTLNGEVDVVLFEGWCVGFRAIENAAVKAKWEESKSSGKGTLREHALEHLEFINESLRGYDVLTDEFQAFVHIDTDDLNNVYTWRLQQEHSLIAKKGSGMTDEQVKAFVDGYMPGYELYYKQLRQGVFNKEGRQLRIIMNVNRSVVGLETI